MRRFLSFGPAFVVLVTAAICLVVVPGAIRRINAAQTQATVILAQQSLDQDDVLERLNRAVRNIAAAVEPSVVHLQVYDDGPRGGFRGASGSGWVYDEQGHIVTNAHVVSGSAGVLVQFFDGRVVDGKLVGFDMASDIAVLRVEPGSHLIPFRRATGIRVERGDRVFAFGSPFNFKFSMSEGIVSGLGRSAPTLVGVAGISNFIQTDAAVNPGNSGGPLVDVRGRVVGMNVAIVNAKNTSGRTERDEDHEGQSAGISMAIPLATIESRVEQLIAGGPVVSGFLGIAFSDTQQYGEDGGAQGRGVRVASVTRGGAAEQAGIEPGDIITALNGEQVSEWDHVRTIISNAKPGQNMTIGVWRDGGMLSFDVTLGEVPAETKTAQHRRVLFEQFGIGLDDTRQGPVAAMVIIDSPAAHCGFEVGQIILGVQSQPVDKANEVVAMLLEGGLFQGRSVKVTVQDGQDGASADPRDLDFRLKLPGR